MSAKTTYADYMIRQWPIMTTPQDVLDLGRSIQLDCERFWDDREEMIRLLRCLSENMFRVKSWKQFRLMRNSTNIVAKRISELPVQKRIGFWD